MKKIREYHIEAYWAEERAKKQKRDEIKDKLFDIIAIGAFIALECFITWEFMRQLFEVL